MIHASGVVRRSTINEEPFSHRCSREIPPNDKNKKKIGRKQNTRFNEVRQFAYVLGVRKRECFIDSITNTISCIYMKRTLPLYL